MFGHATNYISGIKARRKRLFRKAAFLILVGAVSALSFLYVWQSLRVITTGYEIEALKKEKEDLLKTNKALKIEAATLTSPDRIDSIARCDISMKTPGDLQIVTVKRMDRGKGGANAGPRQVRRPGSGPGES